MQCLVERRKCILKISARAFRAFELHVLTNPFSSAAAKARGKTRRCSSEISSSSKDGFQHVSDFCEGTLVCQETVAEARSLHYMKNEVSLRKNEQSADKNQLNTSKRLYAFLKEFLKQRLFQSSISCWCTLLLGEKSQKVCTDFFSRRCRWPRSAHVQR